MRIIKRYSELIRLTSFEERIRYLELKGYVGEETFGGFRSLNQRFYHSPEWRSFRRKIILRDDGMDLAHPDHPIVGKLLIHHLNPVTVEDILEMRSCVFDPENVVCASFDTHNRVHYGYEKVTDKLNGERSPNDTCPWRL